MDDFWGTKPLLVNTLDTVVLCCEGKGDVRMNGRLAWPSVARAVNKLDVLLHMLLRDFLGIRQRCCVTATDEAEQSYRPDRGTAGRPSLAFPDTPQGMTTATK